MWSVIGFEKQKTHFEKRISEGNLSYAYIFSGPEMIGKKSFALDFYKILNKRSQLPLTNDPDLRIIASQDNAEISISQIRELKSFLPLRPYYGPYKMVIIDNADRFSGQAANAFLKLLEEPPVFCILILVSFRPNAVLPTILSRCETVKFLAHSDEVMSKFVDDHKLKKGDRELILTLAQGRPGWVKRNIELDQKLNDIKREILEFNSTLKKGVFERVMYAKKIYENGSYSDLIDACIHWYYRQPNKELKILKGLVQLNSRLAKSEFNHRLAIENFLISL